MVGPYPYIIKNSFIAIMIDSKPYNILDSHPNYQKILDAVKDKRWEEILPLIDLPKVINEYGNGEVNVENGVVLWNGQEVHNSLTKRIIQMKEEGFDIQPMVKFLENLMQNPSKQSVHELYGFLEVCNLPITDDGHFLAYKKVRQDFKDIYSGTFDNSVGKTVEMPRERVNDNRHATCSTGLHFCSLSYLPTMGHSDGHIMILKINPRDVVSIPSDYNDTKGRCCRYEVIGEHEMAQDQESLTKAVYSNKDFATDWDNENEDEENEDEENIWDHSPFDAPKININKSESEKVSQPSVKLKKPSDDCPYWWDESLRRWRSKENNKFIKRTEVEAGGWV